MLNEKGFDLWADDYDRAVGLSDEDGTYPFAGYREILNAIFGSVLSNGAKTVLDIGFGTGTLTAKLYEHGCNVYGQDFSENMIRIAQEKMPDAKLYTGDFSKGLLPELQTMKYDAIIATYSLHHLTDENKAAFLRSLLPLLSEGGSIYVGDIAFDTREEMRLCAERAGSDWDADEIYWAADEFTRQFGNCVWRKFSHCAGILTFGRA